MTGQQLPPDRFLSPRENRALVIALETLTKNAALRREQLLHSGLSQSRKRKMLSISAGILALFSAATITTALSKIFGSEVLQYLAAAVALASGTVSLFVTSYFGDDQIVAALAGSSKYLALRDAVFRLAISRHLGEPELLSSLADLQEQYQHLDADYSKYYPRYFRQSSDRAGRLMERAAYNGGEQTLGAGAGESLDLRLAEAALQDISALRTKLGDPD